MYGSLPKCDKGNTPNLKTFALLGSVRSRQHNRSIVGSLLSPMESQCNICLFIGGIFQFGQVCKLGDPAQLKVPTFEKGGK